MSKVIETDQIFRIENEQQNNYIQSEWNINPGLDKSNLTFLLEKKKKA